MTPRWLRWAEVGGSHPSLRQHHAPAPLLSSLQAVQACDPPRRPRRRGRPPPFPRCCAPATEPCWWLEDAEDAATWRSRWARRQARPGRGGAWGGGRPPPGLGSLGPPSLPAPAAPSHTPPPPNHSHTHTQSARNTAPAIAELGEKGAETWVDLELKLVGGSWVGRWFVFEYVLGVWGDCLGGLGNCLGLRGHWV